MNPSKPFSPSVCHGKSVLFVSPVNYLRTYSGFHYLACALKSQGFNVTALASIPPRMIREAQNTFGYPIESFQSSFLGQLPRLWKLQYKKHLRKHLKCNPDAVILNCINPSALIDDFIKYKNVEGGNRLLLYCPELWLPGEATTISDAILTSYALGVRKADVVIDVNYERAKLRKNAFGLECDPIVLPNSLPSELIPHRLPRSSLEKVLGTKLDNMRRLLLYTGQANNSAIRELSAIMQHVSDEIMLCWISHGDAISAKKALIQLNRQIGSSRCIVATGMPRSKLLEVMHVADAGLILYPCRHIKTANQRFAAPTKLYEYLASGLPIISYGNPSIREIIDKYSVGAYVKDDDPKSIAVAINRLLGSTDLDMLSRRATDAFQNYLSYEKSAADNIDYISRLICSTSDGHASERDR